MKENTISRLFKVVDVVKASPELDETVKSWFLGGIGRCLSGEDLQQALGLKKARYQWLLCSRNAHLLAAWNALELSDEVSEWKRCLELARRIRKFESQSGVRGINSPGMHRLDEVDKCLFMAFRTGLIVPRTGHGVRAIVKSTDSMHLTSSDLSCTGNQDESIKEP